MQKSNFQVVHPSIAHCMSVKKVVEKFEDRSLRNGNRKQRKQFESLTRRDKREWREALQRAINSIQDRRVARVLAGYKPSQKVNYHIQQLSRTEAALVALMQQDDGVVTQGMAPIFASAAAVASVATVVAMNKVSKASEAVEDTMSSFQTTLMNFLEQVKTLGSMLWKPVLAVAVYWMLTKYGVIPVIQAALMGLVTSQIPEALGFYKKLGSGGVSTQAGAVGLAATLVTMVCTFWMPNAKDSSHFAGEFLRRSSFAVRSSEGIESFLKKSIDMVEGLLNFVLRRDESSWISFQGKKNAYDVWRRKVIEMLTLFAKHPTLPIEQIREAKDLQLQGLGFHQILTTQESKRDLSFWLEKLGLALSPHEGAINAENNMRPMPYYIMVGGGSGVGKTTMLRLIGSMVLMLSGECTAKSALENLWQKGTTEYWNGYIGQKCLVMDDAFQVKPKPGDMDSEAMQVIRAVGNWSYPLNFADLVSKGKIYLDTPLVLGTTNCANVSAAWHEFITEPKALIRRFQSAVWVTLNPNFATEDGKFDYMYVRELFHRRIKKISEIASEGKPLSVSDIMDLMPWDIWTLHPHTFDREPSTDRVVPGGLRAVVEAAAAEIKARKVSNREDIQDIQELLRVVEVAMENETTGNTREGLRARMGAIPGIGEIMPLVPDDVVTQAFRRKHEFVKPEVVCDEETGYQPSWGEGVLRMMKEVYDIEAQTIQFVPLDEEERYERECLRLKSKTKIWFDRLLGTHPLLKGIVAVCGTLALVKLLPIVFSVLKHTIVGVVSSVVAAVSGLMGLFGMNIRKDSEDAVETQSNEKVVTPSKGKDDKVMKVASFNFTGDLRVEVGVPPQDHIHDHVYAGTVKCHTDKYVLGQFIGLASDVYMFPKHYLGHIASMDADEKLHFTSARHGLMASITVRAFLQLRIVKVPDYDVAAVSFGGVFLKATRNIVKYFLAQHEVKNMLRGGNTAVRLDVAALNADGTLRRTIYNSPTCYYHGTAHDYAKKLALNGLARYTMPTSEGDCGAPLMVSENRYYGQRCVLGFHSAGRDNVHGREGYGTIVPQELARELVLMLSTYVDHGVEDLELNAALPTGEALVETQAMLDKQGLTNGSFELIGKLSRPVNMPTKTALKVSQMQADELFGVCPTAPAVLRATVRDGEIIQPMARGVEAYQTPLMCDDFVSLQPIVELAMKKHWEATLHHSRDLLTFREAIVPPEGWKLKPINRKTSAGYKYMGHVSPKFPGKTAFFGFEGDVDFENPTNSLVILECDVVELIEDAKHGIRKLHLCTDFLKDELRPKHKVESVSTRVISGTPLDYTIAVRMYFGAYMAAMFDTYVRNGMAPGINHYKEWFMVAEALLEKSNKVFDGDFSRFDSSEQPWVHMPLLDYVNKWYKFNNEAWREEDDRVRYVLWMDLVHSRHITGTGNQLQYVVQWNKSLPSGHPLTTMVNSMYSLVTLAGCYVSLTGDPIDMWEHVCLVTFGDDNINSADDETCEIFNQVTVGDKMQELFGLKYTPGNKSGEYVKYGPITDATFLKRTFVPDDDGDGGLILKCPNVGWVAPLDPNSFLFEPYWYKNARDPLMDMESRVDHMVMELALHPVDMWEVYFPMLQDWCLRHGVALKYTNRAMARSFVKSRFHVWF